MPEQTTRQIVPQGNKGSLPAQRTYGTTDPGGVWAPRPWEGMLNNPLGTYAENGQCNRHGRRTGLYSVQPVCACIGSRLRCRSDAAVGLLLTEWVHSFIALY